MDELISEWRDSGVEEGDVLLVHSSTKRTYKRYLDKGIKLTPNDILDSLLKAVGNSGTLLLPLFNFDYASQGFNINTTPSHMGALTEAARKHPLAIRTGHPIYSFAVIGADADKFKNIDNFSGYGADSPFAVLRKLGGKIAVLDLSDQNSMTFYHHVEEMHEVPYRYHKVFKNDYTDAKGHTTQREYGLFVRDIEKGVQTHVNPAGELMWDAELYQGYRPGEHTGMRVISAQQAYDFISNIIVSGQAKNTLYRIEDETSIEE